MPKKLTVDRVDEENHTHISFKGVIDEESDLRDTFEGIKDNVTINFEGIELINSCGVREWIHAMQKMPQSAKVVYEKCAPRIVEQINYIANFLGSGTVQSFYAPYFCANCKVSVNILLIVDDVGKSRPIEAPDNTCPTCKEPLEFDDIEEEYFSFIE